MLPRAEFNGNCLPSSLINRTPSCALDCLQTFVTTNYAGACNDTTSLTFLCQQDNASGLTIGEGSVQCVASNCVNPDNSILAGLYNVCLKISDSQPETAKTITATVQAVSSSSSLVSSFGLTSSQTTTSLFSTTATSPLTSPTITTGATTSDPSATINQGNWNSGAMPSIVTTWLTTSTTSPPSGSTGSFSTAGHSSSKPSLNTAQISGIAAAAGSVFLIISTLLLLLCRRKRKQRRQVNQFCTDDTLPKSPSYDDGNENIVGQNPDLRRQALSSHDPNEKTPTLPSARRISFWRKSIKLDTTGVVGQPRRGGAMSPTSMYSQKSVSRLLPVTPPRALWPPPLNLNSARERQQQSQRPQSDITIFENEQDTTALPLPPQTFLKDDYVTLPPKTRQRAVPSPIKIPASNLDTFSPGGQRGSVPKQLRIPLTPTYDNGNVETSMAGAGDRYTLRIQTGKPDAEAVEFEILSPERRLPPSSVYSSRNVLRKKSLTKMKNLEPDREQVNQPSLPVTQFPGNRSSITSAHTEIEEDSTPEYEVDKQLMRSASPPKGSGKLPRDAVIDHPLESPIKNLKYPEIPRSAAVSSQAEQIPRARAFLNVPSPCLARSPQYLARDQLVRAGPSFVPTETASSDGYLSDGHLSDPFMGFPQVPQSNSASRTNENYGNNFKSNLARIREASKSTNRSVTDGVYDHPLNKIPEPGESSTTAPVPARSPSTKARLTPSKSRTGDMYLTVEI